MIAMHRLLPLNKKLGFTPPQLTVLWGDLLQHDDPIQQTTFADAKDVVVLTTAHWLLEYAKLDLTAATALLRRMLPSLSEYAGVPAGRSVEKIAESQFLLSLHDYRFVNWTGAPDDVGYYDLKQLRFSDVLSANFVTLLQLDLGSLLDLLLKTDEQNDTGQAPAAAEPAGNGV